MRVPGVRDASCHPSMDDCSTKGELTTRTLKLSYHVWTEEGEPNMAQASLVVRYPDEIRRERVKFTLEGLDLF
jgi:hypothetical protein